MRAIVSRIRGDRSVTDCRPDRYTAEMISRVGEADAFENIVDMGKLGVFALLELLPCRGIEEEVFDKDARPVRVHRSRPFRGRFPFHNNARTREPPRCPGFCASVTRDTAAMVASASPRNPSVRMRWRSSRGQSCSWHGGQMRGLHQQVTYRTRRQ